MNDDIIRVLMDELTLYVRHGRSHLPPLALLQTIRTHEAVAAATTPTPADPTDPALWYQGPVIMPGTTGV